jgi:hypothetical protein
MREEERKSVLEWMGAKTKTILAETKARRDKRMEANTNDNGNKSTACQDAMEANPEKIEQDPGMMQSVEEHQDVPNEDVAVMPVKGLKKRRREQKSTAGRRGEPKKLNRGNFGSRKKLAAACRKV